MTAELLGSSRPSADRQYLHCHIQLHWVNSRDRRAFVLPFKQDAIQTPRQFATLVSLELRQLLTCGHSQPQRARLSPKKHGAGLKPHKL